MSGGRKFDSKKYKDLRDFKSKEIKRSLVHRARLRKNYFKLIEKEGGRPSTDPVDELKKEPTKGENTHRETKGPRHERNDVKKSNLTYYEKSQLIKQRKEEKRQAILQDVRERRDKIEKSNQQRDRMKEKLSQKTKHGQPLMGPRINNLLDKIKKDMS
ncbi:rRNA-processing protein fyv7 [Yamadazyma tenuis]|uniref:rRNA-processing protein FYV7 n=1 Tax=Candida tenuis (strain ATCC 10573 / BCRC 21748 / CBS 615 / JCM 9827 / NBRC 10315 / NRRL Y-1498 / VKM Y-70) TaxID=590646 RepID=G3B6I4_CANTC|nr:rRNA processing [Yamadazyma tenuis ATCC 10573]EGV63476.1 rRNA processing [Yamadazyma tenuis ATCC 10573]WEJ96699.1 rRNA-processing protein fyv7 [Yamadazyma tenuis]